MKSKIIVMLITVLMLSGCFPKEDIPIVEETKKTETALEKQFKETFLEIYQNIENWLAEDEDKKTVMLTLEDMNKVYDRDISMYINEETNNSCDISNSYVLLTVRRESGEEKIDIQVVLDCFN